MEGQSRIARSEAIERVWVTPGDVRASEDAVRAIEEAEVVVIGPGSLYTSILPALLVPGIREAIAASGALVVFACNVATQAGETGGYDLADHVDALGRHGAAGLPDIVLANNRFDAEPPGRLAGRAGPPALAARGGREGAATARARRPRRPGQRPPPRPRPPGRRDHAASGSGRAATAAGRA